VVLNSLAGTAMERSLDVLGSFGRFVEIGVRDLYEHNRRVGLRHFRKSQAFFAVDLKRLIDERPETAGALMQEITSFVARQRISPLPYETYGPDRVSEAFRQMSQARHIGKIVISLEGQPVPVTPPRHPEPEFRADGAYLIAGGLGGLGLTTAEWMAGHGAGHLVLVGRRPASDAARQLVAGLRERGVSVTEVAADVTDGRQVREIIAMIETDLPPLRGVIHAAAVLDDGIVAQMSERQLRDVMAPKMLGAWNLHVSSLRAPLDFFVMFSSAAGLLGSPGQGNYCAANAFLDSLAELRRSRGLPALSIAWGAWADVGLAAQQENRGKRLAARGVASMNPAQGLEALGRVLALDAAQLAVVPFDYQRWCEFYPQARSAPVFGRLPRRGESAGLNGSAPAIRQAMHTADPGERRELIEGYLRERAARILGFAGGNLDAEASLHRLGMDSLMAVELRNAIEADLGVTIPVMNLLQGVTMGELAGLIDDQIGRDAQQGSTAGETAAQQPAPAQPLLPQPDLEHLSDKEVADLLAYLEDAPSGEASASTERRSLHAELRITER
jgi:phthiocerol/phenolphthiocerol synthesis type-I polyketide synthase C